MLARIIDNKTISIEQITPAEESILIKAFSVKDPKARYIDTTMGNFDGWYRKYNIKHKRLDRALLGELRKACTVNKLPLSIVDMRPASKYPAPDESTITPDYLPGITLDKHQLEAIRPACRAEIGLIEAPTGSGKSELIAAYTKLFNCPTVIIAEQKVVVTQLKARLELREVVKEAGLFMAGKRPNGQTVIIGSLASLIIPKPPEKSQDDTAEAYTRKLKAYATRRKNAKLLREMVGKCDLLLIDEADKAVNKQYRFLCKYWYSGRRKYGFSGTFFDPATPVKNLHLKENLGSIISYTSRDEVQAAGRIIPINYIAIAFGDPKDRNRKETYDTAISELMINNPKYHKLITSLAVHSIKRDDYGTMILVDSIPLGKRLNEILLEQGVVSEFIYGATPDKKRDEIIKKFEAKEVRVLIGSKILKRGLDLQGGCETLIIACDDQRWSEFNQIIGRAVRKNKLGVATVYDVYFVCNYYLYEHSRKRIKHVSETSYNACVRFPHVTISTRDLIKSRFRIPKERK